MITSNIVHILVLQSEAAEVYLQRPVVASFPWPRGTMVHIKAAHDEWSTQVWVPIDEYLVPHPYDAAPGFQMRSYLYLPDEPALSRLVLLHAAAILVGAGWEYCDPAAVKLDTPRPRN